MESAKRTPNVKAAMSFASSYVHREQQVRKPRVNSYTFDISEIRVASREKKFNPAQAKSELLPLLILRMT